MSNAAKNGLAKGARANRLRNGARAVQSLFPTLLGSRANGIATQQADPKLQSAIEAAVLPHLMSLLNEHAPPSKDGSRTVPDDRAPEGKTHVDMMESRSPSQGQHANGKASPFAAVSGDTLRAGGLSGDWPFGSATWPSPFEDDPLPLVQPVRRSGVEDEDLKAFMGLLCEAGVPEAMEFVDRLMARGVGRDEILLDLCAPAAQELGAMWCSDDCSFCEVTIGVSVLETVLIRTASREPLHRMMDRSGQRRVLLAHVGGTQHAFGLTIMKALFLQSGWQVDTVERNDPNALLDVIHDTGFTVVGFSVGAKDSLPDCRSLIRDIRAVPNIVTPLLVVGGPAILDPGPDTRALDADLLVRDGREGIRQIERMVGRLAQHEQRN